MNHKNRLLDSFQKNHDFYQPFSKIGIEIRKNDQGKGIYLKFLWAAQKLKNGLEKLISKTAK